MELEMQYDKIALQVFGARKEMGAAAAKDAGTRLIELLDEKDEVNCIFASAPSQNEVIDALAELPGVDWTRVNAFHMDEYIGIPPGDARSFSGYLEGRIFRKLPFKAKFVIDGMAEPQAECARYAALLRRHPADLAFMGIGENGHLAFNDPPVADFDDPEPVKVVTLERACRLQQVNDGCFPNLEAVPERAITLTIPALLAAKDIFCVVPGPRKAAAVRDTLIGPIGEVCPATALRRADGVRMYVDTEAMSEMR